MKAICPICHRKITLMASGHLRRHVRTLGSDGAICEGSWQIPERLEAVLSETVSNAVDVRRKYKC